MKPYSQFLYQAGTGRNKWAQYALLLAIAWGGSFLLNKLVTFFVNPNLLGSELWGYGNVVRHVSAVALLILLMMRIHQRPFSSLLTSRPQLDMNRLAFGLIVSAGLLFGLAALGIWLLYDMPLIWAWNGGKKGSEILGQLIFFPISIIAYDLFFKSYILQGLTQWLRKPLSAILLTTLIIWLVGHSYLLWGFFSGNLGGVEWSWFFNSYIFVTFFLLILVVLDEGIELALSFSLGQVLYACLIDQEAMRSRVAGMESAWSDDMVYFFSYGWGRILVIILFLLIVSRRFKLRDRSILSVPIPPAVDEQFDLIDQIGQK